MTPTATHATLHQKTYEGKAKVLSPGSQPNTLNVQFKDEATAFNGEKFANIPGKGQLNATISRLLFEYLNSHGIRTCYLKAGNDDDTLVYETLNMIPLEVVVRNVAYGSVSKRYQLADGTPFKQPVVEYFWKKDAANDPLITRDVIRELELVPQETTLDAIEYAALMINELLLTRFSPANIVCADFKLEFGLSTKGELVLGDELSPDNFRLRDVATVQILDKDVFRLDKADLVETYTEVLNRLNNSQPEPAQQPNPYTATVLVTSRKNILNPESKAITQAVQRNGFSDVLEVNAGKLYTIQLQAVNRATAHQAIDTLGKTVLSNPVIEDYQVTSLTQNEEAN